MDNCHITYTKNINDNSIPRPVLIIKPTKVPNAALKEALVLLLFRRNSPMKAPKNGAIIIETKPNGAKIMPTNKPIDAPITPNLDPPNFLELYAGST